MPPMAILQQDSERVSGCGLNKSLLLTVKI
jgi:hypothetical protein